MGGTSTVVIEPKQAANRFYDKHISRIVDTVVSQDIHLRRLRDIQFDAKQQKRPAGDLLATSSSANYHLEEKKELLYTNIQRNRINSRVFKINEEMGHVFKQNIALQKRLDTIKQRGPGGSYPSPSYYASKISRTPAGHGARGSARGKTGFSPSQTDGFASKGSLNFVAKKREALRIDSENLKMAKRIVNQGACLSTQKLEEEGRFTDRVKARILKGGYLGVEQIFKQRRGTQQVTNFPLIARSNRLGQSPSSAKGKVRKDVGHHRIPTQISMRDTFDQQKSSTLEAGKDNQFFQTLSDRDETPSGIVEGNQVDEYLTSHPARSGAG